MSSLIHTPNNLLTCFLSMMTSFMDNLVVNCSLLLEKIMKLHFASFSLGSLGSIQICSPNGLGCCSWQLAETSYQFLCLMPHAGKSHTPLVILTEVPTGVLTGHLYHTIYLKQNEVETSSRKLERALNPFLTILQGHNHIFFSCMPKATETGKA